MGDHLFMRAFSMLKKPHGKQETSLHKSRNDPRTLMGNLPILHQYPSFSFSHSAPVGWQSCGQGNLTRERADLAEKQSHKICDFCYFVWSSFCFFLRAETQTAVMAPSQAQDRTQLTLVSYFILRTAIQMLSDRTGILQKVPVRVIGVFGITDVCVAMADTAPSNADILDAVVILESTRKAGHYYFYKSDS